MTHNLRYLLNGCPRILAKYCSLPGPNVNPVDVFGASLIKHLLEQSRANSRVLGQE